MTESKRHPLKIALVCDWYLPRMGGIECHLRDLGAELAKRGHQVDIITTLPGGSGSGKVRIIRIAARLLPIYEVAFTKGAFLQLEQVLVEQGYDVVHCHYSYISPFASVGLYLCVKHGIPAVVTLHSFLGRLVRVLPWVARWVDWPRWPVVFSAVSEVLATDVRSMGVGLEPLILTNGVERDRWQRSSRQRDDQEVRIISVMRLCRRKRPLQFIVALARIKKLLPTDIQLHVRIIGSGPASVLVKLLIMLLGLGENVELLGQQPRDRIPALLSESDIFVLPSILESFGIAALEARCAGLPVVAMRHGGVASFVEDGRDGFLVEDDREMIRRLVLLISDAELRRKMAEQSRNSPPALDWEAVVGQHIDIYGKAMNLCRN